MSLITSATSSGLSIKQVAVNAATLPAADALTSTAKKVAVKDDLSAVRSNFADLLTNINKISSIQVNDIGALSFSAAELKTYGTVIAKITGSHDLSITGTQMADLPTILKNKSVKSIEINDTEAKIASGFGTLIANNSKIKTITKSDVGVALTDLDMSISSSNYKLANAPAGVLSKFASGSFATGKIQVTGVAASDVAALTSASVHPNITKVTISDSLSNIFNNAAAITAAGAKVDSISTTASKAPIKTMAAGDYGAYKSANSGLITKVNAGNAKALDGAFALTGASIADLTTGGVNAIGVDTRVKSIAVTDTAANAVAATTAELSKVTKADLTADKADVDSTLLTQLAGLGSKLSSLKLNAGEGDKLDGLDVSNIKNKATALVLAKTKGEHGDPVGLEVTGAKLADVNGLLANKQVNKADISDTAKNMLAFSADKFTMLANSKNVSFAITDSAANISKYHTQLASAVKQFNTDRVTLSVKDTAANLEKNLEALDEVATAITGADANGQSKYDSSRVKIQQSATTGGVAETSTLIKVAYANYSERRDVLQYIKDATAGMVQAHVEVDTANTDIAATADARSAWSVQRAKDISNTLQFQRYIVDAAGLPTPAPTPPNPIGNKVTMTGLTEVIGGIGIRAADNTIANDSSTFGISSDDGKTWITGAIGKTANKLYSDIAQIDITLRGTNVSADLVKIKADKDLTTGTGATDLLKAVTTSVSMYV